MKKLNYIFSIIVASLTLFSCSDEFQAPFIENPIPEGFLRVNINVPESSVVRSRDVQTTDESAINELDIFLFSTDGSSLIAHNSFTDVKENVDVQIPGAFSSSSMLLYAVANVKEKVSGVSSLSELESVTLSTAEASATGTVSTTGFVMAGNKEIVGNQGLVSVDMLRIIAKMSMKLASSIPGVYKLQQFTAYQVNGNVNLTSPINSSKKFNTDVLASPYGIESTGYAAYISPTKFWNKEGNTPEPLKYILVGIAYNENADFSKALSMSWYCLTLENETEGIPEALDVEPNHFYTIEITSIDGEGYSTVQEALKHPESKNFLKYIIHDHAAQVMSMVTDGVRELGVTGDFDWDEQAAIAETDANMFTTYLTVKWYSPYSEEMSDNNKPSVILESNWLAIDGVTELNDVREETSGNHDDDSDTSGRRMRFKLSLKPDASFDQDAVVEVTWMSLKREIKVSRNALATNLSSLCNVELQINKGGTFGGNKDLTDMIEQIPNYWDFLAGKETDGINGTKVKLYGVDIEAMGEDKPRDRGLHFPVMYGETSSPSDLYRYVYKIDFKNLYGENAKIVNVEYPNGSNNLTTLEPTLSTGPTTYARVYINNNVDYRYWSTPIRFTVTDGNGGTHYHNITAYHTGFFHYHGADEVNDPGYYYYEVVPFNIGGTDYYWLDRNLGAKSCKMYIESAAGTVEYGDADAAGALWTVATPGVWDDVDKQKPTQLKTVCPPGYHVPSKTEWDRVRNSNRFSMEQKRDVSNGQYYFTSQFETGHKEIGNIYFPKARYSDGTSKVGDAATGYYWTMTAAEGLEKEQIGQWLKVLAMNGSSSSYINGSIEDQDKNRDGHRMSLRCAAGAEPEADTKYTVSFNVRGATNVFLYDRITKTPVFSFPGKAIGTPKAVESWIVFTYSSTIPKDDLEVLFSYVDANGKVVLYSPDGYSYKVNENYNLSEAMKAGWTVYQGGMYDFLYDPSEYDSENPNVRSDSEEIHPGSDRKNYRFYWSKSLGSGVNLYIQSLGKTLVDVGSTDLSAGNYYYVEFSSTYSGTVTYEFRDGDTYYESSKNTNAGTLQDDFIKVQDFYCAYVSSGLQHLQKGAPTDAGLYFQSGDKITFNWGSYIQPNYYKTINVEFTDGSFKPVNEQPGNGVSGNISYSYEFYNRQTDGLAVRIHDRDASYVPDVDYIVYTDRVVFVSSTDETIIDKVNKPTISKTGNTYNVVFWTN